MKMLVLRGNPRKDGHTQYITDLAVKGATEAGASVDDIDLNKVTIDECTGCYLCWTATPGECIHRDAMGALLEMLLASDMLLCSTPLYSYTMSSRLKKFFERVLPLFKPVIQQSPSGHFRNSPRYPDRWKNKKLAFISAGAFKGEDNFEGLHATFTLLANGMGMKFCGGLIRPESYLLQFNLAKPKTVRIIETALIQSGRELVLQGCISEETRQKVSIPLSVDTGHFLQYSNIYWEHVFSMGAEGADLEKVRRRVTGDVRILMREMARSIDPLTTAKLKIVLQFDFPDKDLYYCLTVKNGACTLEEKRSETFDLLITTDSSTWAKAFIREISMKDALLEKKIRLEGDKMLFRRLEKYFPPPVS